MQVVLPKYYLRFFWFVGAGGGGGVLQPSSPRLVYTHYGRECRPLSSFKGDFLFTL